MVSTWIELVAPYHSDAPSSDDNAKGQKRLFGLRHREYATIEENDGKLDEGYRERIDDVERVEQLEVNDRRLRRCKLGMPAKACIVNP